MTDFPFGITRSYSPRLRTEPVNVSAPAAKDFVAIFNKVIAASEKAKTMMKSQADKHRSIAPIYKIGDQVWLSTNNLCMLNRTLKKLTESVRCLDYRVNIGAVCRCGNNDGPEAGNTRWRRSIEFPDLK